jgi:uncharacterized RDD family membrane protein YckC
LIDQLALLIPNVFVAGFAFALLSQPNAWGRRPDEGAALAACYLAGALLSWLYAATMESSPWQATLGKKALGLMVTDIQGQRISFGRATGRHFGKILSGVILGIGFLAIAFTSKKQGWHDDLADTLVLRKSP